MNVPVLEPGDYVRITSHEHQIFATIKNVPKNPISGIYVYYAADIVDADAKVRLSARNVRRDEVQFLSKQGPWAKLYRDTMHDVGWERNPYIDDVHET